MDRPNIEGFLEVAEKATKGRWGCDFGGQIWANGKLICHPTMIGDIKLIAAGKNDAPDIARYALILEKALELACEYSNNILHNSGMVFGCPHSFDMVQWEQCNQCDKFNAETWAVACWRDYFLNKAKEGEA